GRRASRGSSRPGAGACRCAGRALQPEAWLPRAQHTRGRTSPSAVVRPRMPRTGAREARRTPCRTSPLWGSHARTAHERRLVRSASAWCLCGRHARRQCRVEVIAGARRGVGRNPQRVRAQLLEPRPCDVEVLEIEQIHANEPLAVVPREPYEDGLELAALGQRAVLVCDGEVAVLLRSNVVEDLEG